MTQYRLKASRTGTTVSELTTDLDGLLAPNGDVPFVIWWLRQAEEQNCERVQIVTVKTGLLGGDYEEVLEP